MRYNALDPKWVIEDEWEQLPISERWARSEPTAPARAADLVGRVVGLLWIACRFAAAATAEFWPEALAAGLLVVAFGPARGGAAAVAILLVSRRSIGRRQPT